MPTVVGPKGQVVIEKPIRDALGILPGSLAVQRRVGRRVEIEFFPPEHSESLAGLLAPHTRRTMSDDELNEAIDAASALAAAEDDRRVQAEWEDERRAR